MKFDPDESRKRIEAGGIPLEAEARLAEVKANPGFFTSTLTVTEQALAHASGYDPICMVMGSCYYHVGWSSFSGWGGGELDTMTHALYEVRNLAIGRLILEARAAGAHAVVGVQVTSRHHEEHLEYTALGTAIRVRGAAPTDNPPATLMDADQLRKCHIAGYWPVGIALANCVWYDPHCDCSRDGSWFSQPLSAHNLACHTTEDRVSQRFHEHVAQMGADGVLGVRLVREPHEHHHDGHTTFRLEMLMIGTAVRRVPPLEARRDPLVVLDLSKNPPPPKPPPGRASH
jgi:uncharacterized protein YbjQ (UPF0145 family)